MKTEAERTASTLVVVGSIVGIGVALGFSFGWEAAVGGVSVVLLWTQWVNRVNS